MGRGRGWWGENVRWKKSFFVWLGRKVGGGEGGGQQGWCVGRIWVREEVNSVEGEKKGVVVVGLGELNELVKLMCGGLVVPLSL